LGFNLGLAYLSQNDWPKAIKTLQTAVSLGRDHPEAHFNLAIAYESESSLDSSSAGISTRVRSQRRVFLQVI
jgi:Tfp pilus assembly protein PilF